MERNGFGGSPGFGRKQELDRFQPAGARREHELDGFQPVRARGVQLQQMDLELAFLEAQVAQLFAHRAGKLRGRLAAQGAQLRARP